GGAVSRAAGDRRDFGVALPGEGALGHDGTVGCAAGAANRGRAAPGACAHFRKTSQADQGGSGDAGPGAEAGDPGTEEGAGGTRCCRWGQRGTEEVQGVMNGELFPRSPTPGDLGHPAWGTSFRGRS